MQLGLPIASLSGWSLCWADLYSDTTTTEQDVLAKCPGGKLMLACRPTGDPILQVAAMGDRADVTWPFMNNDNTSTHPGNGVGWYMSPMAWGFIPGGDTRDGSCDATGISPSVPGPDGDRRICWYANTMGKLDVGFRCGYDCDQNHPGFDYKYERVVFSAP